MSVRGPYETSPMPEEPRNLAERLRWLRKQRGLTQVEVSEALGCEQAMVSSWEVGRTRPSAIAMGALARYYQLSIVALETGEGFSREAVESYTNSLKRAASSGKDMSGMQLNLPQTAPGQLLVVDASTGNGDPTDPAEGMAKLLRALKKGRQAWIVIK
jgi:transcriptional regulator with XRE-family HTH domain